MPECLKEIALALGEEDERFASFKAAAGFDMQGSFDMRNRSNRSARIGSFFDDRSAGRKRLRSRKHTAATMSISENDAATEPKSLTHALSSADTASIRTGVTTGDDEFMSEILARENKTLRCEF